MKRILVIDDDADVLKYCKIKLSALEHEVVTTFSAEEALKILSSEKFDLLIVDIVMPKQSGFELLRALRSNPNFRSKILMLTGRRTPQDVVRALELGAVDYVCKPIDKDTFLPKVQSVLGVQSFAKEIHFAHGASEAGLSILVQAEIEALSESGITFFSSISLDPNTNQKIDSTVFAQIGINPPLIRILSCRLLEKEYEIGYQVTATFIGLDEASLKKIRQWVNARAIASRKVA